MIKLRIKVNLRVMAVEGVTPGAGDSNLGDDSLEAGPVSQSSSPTWITQYLLFIWNYFKKL